MPQKINNILSSKLSNYITSKAITVNNKIFKSGKGGVIALNGVNIRIAPSETFETLANKINSKRHLTKISAETVIVDGNTKLLLKSKDQNVNFYDPKNIFLNHYENKLLGTSKDSLIQVVNSTGNGKNNNIVLNYQTAIAEPQNSSIRLSEFNKMLLARQRTNNILDSATELVPVPTAPTSTPPSAPLPTTEVPTVPTSTPPSAPLSTTEAPTVPTSTPPSAPLPMTEAPTAPTPTAPSAPSPSSPITYVTGNRNKLGNNTMTWALRVIENKGREFLPGLKDELFKTLSAAIANNPKISNEYLSSVNQRKELAKLIGDRLYNDRKMKYFGLVELADFQIDPLKKTAIVTWVANLVK